MYSLSLPAPPHEPPAPKPRRAQLCGLSRVQADDPNPEHPLNPQTLNPNPGLHHTPQPQGLTAHSSATFAESRPMTDTMPDGLASAAACMLSPRSLTSLSPSSKLCRRQAAGGAGARTRHAWCHSCMQKAR